jgi:hypothetical protein
VKPDSVAEGGGVSSRAAQTSEGQGSAKGSSALLSAVVVVGLTSAVVGARRTNGDALSSREVEVAQSDRGAFTGTNTSGGR